MQLYCTVVLSKVYVQPFRTTRNWITNDRYCTVLRNSVVVKLVRLLQVGFYSIMFQNAAVCCPTSRVTTRAATFSLVRILPMVVVVAVVVGLVGCGVAAFTGLAPPILPRTTLRYVTSATHLSRTSNLIVQSSSSSRSASTTTATVEEEQALLGSTTVHKENYDIVTVDLADGRDYPIYIGTSYSDQEGA